MLLINISVDGIFLSDGEKYFYLSNAKLENTFPSLLVNFFNLKKHKKIIVINGPGSFTALRIGTLSINCLNYLYQYGLNVYEISKISIYDYLVKKNFLPSNGLLFIGQRKNLRKYDFNMNTYEYFNIDNVKEGNYFLDQVFEIYPNIINYKNIVKININSKEMFNIFYEGKSYVFDISELNLQSKKSITPNYLLQPNIQL